MPSSRTGAGPSDAERLRRIEAVTDAALAHLDVSDLLVELLDRVREILEVDTAAVLLVDRDTDELVATAAVGIEDEVRMGVRIPMGEGFAGQVAASVEPLVLEQVDPSTVHNPLLWEKGIVTLAGVPLVSESRVIGVLHLGSLTPRTFSPEDINLLQMVGDRVALAVQSRRSNVERAAAAALQRSLIPTRLPTIPGLELAARYLPASAGGVGGDWYDVFPLPSGRIGVVMGDVIGRGLAAAVVMGRLRSALRAYALDSPDPAEVLERLDRKVQHFEAGQMTTVLYGVLDAALTTMAVSAAGHPLPVAMVGEGPAVSIDATVDPPLGVVSGVRRHSCAVALVPGSILALFTDGLIERRGESIEDGLERLRNALSPVSATEACAGVIAELIGDADPADDAALLVIRREVADRTRPLHLEVPAVPTSLGHIRAALRRWLSTIGAGDNETFNVLLAVGEATGNAVEHAYGPGGGTLRVEMTCSAQAITATVRDSGRWRSPRGENRGRGLGIIENCTDEMSMVRTASGTEVCMRFRIDQVPQP